MVLFSDPANPLCPPCWLLLITAHIQTSCLLLFLLHPLHLLSSSCFHSQPLDLKRIGAKCGKDLLIATCVADLHIFSSTCAFSKLCTLLGYVLTTFVHFKLHVLFIFRLSLVPGIRNALFLRRLTNILDNTSGELLHLSGVAHFCTGGSAPLHLSPASMIS